MNLDEERLKSMIEEDKNRVLDALIKSVCEIPDTIRDIIQHVLSEVARKWPNEPTSTIQSATLM